MFLWALLKLSKRKSVHRNLPLLSTILYVSTMLLLNLMYRGYVNFGGGIITNSQVHLLVLVFFSCINYNSFMWTFWIQNPLILVLQWYLYHI